MPTLQQLITSYNNVHGTTFTTSATDIKALAKIALLQMLQKTYEDDFVNTCDKSQPAITI